MSVLGERVISPEADLTPVYVGNFCYLANASFDALNFGDQKVIKVALLALVGVAAWKKGISLAQWTFELVVLLASEKFFKASLERYRKDGRWKSEKSLLRFCQVAGVSNAVASTVSHYFKGLRNPSIPLKSTAFYGAVTIGLSVYLEYRSVFMHKKAERYSKEYFFEIVTASRYALLLLSSYGVAKGIEKAVGASPAVNWKFTVASYTAQTLFTILHSSPNSPFYKPPNPKE